MKKGFFAFVTAVVVAFVTALALCVQALNAPKEVFSLAGQGMKIVVGAGHGGIDGGVTGITTGVKESHLNLKIALKLKEVLSDMGFEVTLTRKTEGGLYGTPSSGFKRRDMEKRKEIIERAKPSLIVSVHQNRYPAQSVRGGQVFYRVDDKDSELLGLAVQEQMNALYAKQGVKARKAVAGEYYMLSCYDAPSMIVECGFLSSPLDEKLLLEESFQRQIASRVATGVLTYLSNLTS